VLRHSEVAGGDSMIKKNHITHPRVIRATHALLQRIRATLPPVATGIYPIPRGGVPAAYALLAGARRLGIDLYLTGDPAEAHLFVDDLIDSGATRRRYTHDEAGNKKPVPFAALFTKRLQQDLDSGHTLYGEALPPDQWVVFPWEASEEGSASDIVTRFFQFIGEDPAREGLKETPARVIAAWGEWYSGYKASAQDVLKAFKDGAERVDELVVVRDIPFFSHCEHHLAPFFGVAHVGYIPDGSIVGLSKFVRLTEVFSRRLQVQERLTNQIADAITEFVKPKGVGVVIQARHFCMESRGVCKAGSSTVTSAMRGALLTKPEARAEFFSLVGGRHGQ
jgi:GTP cyclohydrolase I